MKSSLILATTLLSTSLAVAGSWNYDFRGDMTSTAYNDAAKSAGLGQDNYRFNLHTVKVDGKGKLSDSIQYRLRFNSGNSDKAVSSRDSVSKFVDLAYASHSPIENLWITFGKFSSEMGGQESAVNTANTYFTSEYFDKITRYYTGAKVAYMMGDSEINVHTANLDADSTGANGKFNQGRSYMAVVYKGSFMEKTLMPILSYHTSSPQGAGDQKNTYIAAGLKYSADDFWATIDYLTLTLKDATTVGKDDTTDTVVLEAQYKALPVMPKLKLESSNSKTNPASGENKVATTGIGLALEYQPESDKDFRYHVAYTTKNSKPDSGDARITNALIVGMRLAGDFLK